MQPPKLRRPRGSPGWGAAGAPLFLKGREWEGGSRPSLRYVWTRKALSSCDKVGTPPPKKKGTKWFFSTRPGPQRRGLLREAVCFGSPMWNTLQGGEGGSERPDPGRGRGSGWPLRPCFLWPLASPASGGRRAACGLAASSPRSWHRCVDLVREREPPRGARPPASAPASPAVASKPGGADSWGDTTGSRSRTWD